MRKLLLIFLIFLLNEIFISAQLSDPDFIDSLKKRTYVLQGTERVDVINFLAQRMNDYYGTKAGWKKGYGDSCFYYAKLAYENAKKLNYKIGLVNALLNMTEAEAIKLWDPYLPNPRKSIEKIELTDIQKKYLLEALPIANEIDNDELLGKIYNGLGFLFGINQQESDEYIQKAISYFRKAGSEEDERGLTTILCEIYSSRGSYQEGLEFCQRSLELSKKLLASAKTKEEEGRKLYLVQTPMIYLSNLYKAAGDYETALVYLSQADKVDGGWGTNGEKAFIYMEQGKMDSAAFYFGKLDTSKYFPKMDLARFYLAQNKFDEAIGLVKKFYYDQKKDGKYGTTAMIMSKANLGKKNYPSALSYAKEYYNSTIVGKTDRPILVMDTYQLFAKIYRGLGKDKLAYTYLEKYYALKDSLVNNQFRWKLNNYKKTLDVEKKTSQINILDKENKLKDQRLKQQAFIRNALLGGLLLLLLLGIFVFRSLTWKRKNERMSVEKKQAELQRKVTELEMQALRAQMNPHFIFNCLSSINKFILKNDTDAASDYLTRFSRLIRFGLTNSQLSVIPLSDEIEMLRLYLDMERLRFSETFDYNIIYENTIEPETIYIPPMLLQPFCENAIWHGLMHKQGQGKLEVILSIRDNQLQCIITDNGIGREKAAELKTKSGARQKSFGLKITTERLALFNNEKAIHSFYNTEDILDEDGNVDGTKVTLNINYKPSVAAYAT